MWVTIFVSSNRPIFWHRIDIVGVGVVVLCARFGQKVFQRRDVRTGFPRPYLLRVVLPNRLDVRLLHVVQSLAGRVEQGLPFIV